MEIFKLFPNETFLKADGYDDCIIGVTPDLRLIYNSELMIEKLKKEMSEEEAWEFFDFNILGAYMGEKTPLYVTVC